MSKQKTKLDVFAELLQIYNRKMTKGAMERMLKHFDDVSDLHFEKSVDRLVCDSEFMPTVADILDSYESHIQHHYKPHEEFVVVPPSDQDYEDMVADGLI